MCKRSVTAVEDQILNTTSPHENSKPLIGWAHVNPATKLGGLLFSNLCRSTEELVKTINVTIRVRYKTKTTDIESVTLVITVLSGKPPTKKRIKVQMFERGTQRRAVRSIKPLPVDRTRGVTTPRRQGRRTTAESCCRDSNWKSAWRLP